jgi:uncharacterized LabA/DUF88 family protein
LKERRKKYVRNFFKVLFSKQEGSKIGKKKKALVFVDFEHWYISLDRLYKARPDVIAFRDELTDRYEISDIIFFGDFSNPSLRQEIGSIRRISNTIIDTQNTSTAFEKDFTDFIMLDHIYQRAMNSREIDAYIIFTGDGHFSSAVSFLTTKCGKEVGVYAIKKACSTQLAGCATYTRLLPSDDELTEPSSKYSRMILQSLKRLQEKNKSKTRATFWQTVEAVSKQNKVGKEEVTSSLRTLIAKGYIYQVKESEKPDSIRILKVNWQQVYKDRLL